MPLSPEVEKWMEWRERERRKRRTMTAREYSAWLRDGDAISSPTATDAFPGGLTIILASDKSGLILGSTSSEPQ